jgi:C4-dicarboxylate transporter, DctM subunit
MIGVTLAILIGLLAVAVPVAAVLGVLGLVLSEVYSRLPLSLAMGEMAWATSNNFLLVAVPFFVMLGEMLLRSGMAERMYNALVLWMPWLPGGLMHSNIAACALFSATSGSSVATAATIGTVAMGEIKKHGYNERLFLGTIAAGGTLGILIPPSINMIVYGVLTETSIPKLYLAGILPGLVLALGCSASRAPGLLPAAPGMGRQAHAWRRRWEQRRRALPDLVPPLVIFVAVIGSIYAGWATATESAALGVLMRRSAGLPGKAADGADAAPRPSQGTMRTTAMIMAILIAAYFLNFVITSIGLTTKVNRFITSLGLSPTELLIVVVLFYIVLGMFMETLSMMVATVPIIAPIMFQAGYDMVWFGILVILLVETALITPPVGLNLFVVQGLRKRGKIDDVIIGTLPFVVTLMLMMVVISVFPDLVLMLPRAASD